jgi:hypothetical protein
VAGGTEFVMTLDDLPPGTVTAKQMVQGGSLIINSLKSLVETGQLPLGTRVLYAMFALMGPLAPKEDPCRELAAVPVLIPFIVSRTRAQTWRK